MCNTLLSIIPQKVQLWVAVIVQVPVFVHYVTRAVSALFTKSTKKPLALLEPIIIAGKVAVFVHVTRAASALFTNTTPALLEPLIFALFVGCWFFLSTEAI